MRIVPVALIVATHPQQCKALVCAFDQLAIRSALAFTVEEACRTLITAKPALVVTAADLLDGTYQDILRHASQQGLPTILLLRPSEIHLRALASQAGVAGLLTFPFTLVEVEQVLRQVCGHRRGGRNLAASA